MLEDLYPQAVQIGISSTDFWSMTFDEIMVQVEANKKRHENELREKAMFDYSQQRMAIFAFNDPKNFPKFEEAYPYTFAWGTGTYTTSQVYLNTGQFAAGAAPNNNLLTRQSSDLSMTVEVGDNTNHNNWQPFVTVYFWRRTA